MQHLNSHKRSSVSSCDSQTPLQPLPSNNRHLQPEGALLMTPSGHRDELLVLLKGKNYFTHFEKPSKISKMDTLRPMGGERSSLACHLANRKREHLKKKRLADSIQREKIERYQSEKKFLKRNLTVEAGLTCKNSRFP